MDTSANFNIRWDDFMETSFESESACSVDEVSEQELLYEMKVDPHFDGIDGLDLSLFDVPMEEESEETTPKTGDCATSPIPEKEQNSCTTTSAPSVETSKSAEFIELNNEDIQKFVKEQENKSTLRKTLGDIEKFNRFLRMKGEKREMKDIAPDELDIFVANFILSVRKADGGEYEPSTIRNMVSSLERKLRRQSYPVSILNSKTEFNLTKDTLRAKLKSLKKLGKGNRPKEAKAITDDEINILLEKKQLGDDSPQALINTLWLNNTIHFGLRGVTEHYDLRFVFNYLLTNPNFLSVSCNAVRLT